MLLLGCHHKAGSLTVLLTASWVQDHRSVLYEATRGIYAALKGAMRVVARLGSF